MSEAERLRKAAHVARMQRAEEYYQECLNILATYNGPGGGKAYRTAEEAQAARKKYKRAHATVRAKTPAGRAHSRHQDTLKRMRGKGIRHLHGAGVGEFYRRMITEPQVCFYCDKPLAPDERVGDHFMPLAKGGEHAAYILSRSLRRL